MRAAAILTAGIVFVGFLVAYDVETAKMEFPDQCEDGHRENSQNRNSQCRFVGELTLEKVEWMVYPDYPHCYDKLRLHVTGHEDMLSVPGARATLTWHNEKADTWSSIYYYPGYASGDYIGRAHDYHPTGLHYDDITETYIDVVVRGGSARTSWDMDQNNSIGIPYVWDTRPDTELFLEVVFTNPPSKADTGGDHRFYDYGYRYSFSSNRVPNASEFVGGIELIYGCIDLLYQEKEDREHAVKVREEEVAALEAARV